MMPPPAAPPIFMYYSWIGLTALSPLSAFLLSILLISIHKRRTKSILLLSIVYSQLCLTLLTFIYSTLYLLKLDKLYITYINYGWNVLIFYKSMSCLSLHLEEYYKLRSPSNYILNINSSLLKYHLLVLGLLSLMGTYFVKQVRFVPLFNFNDLYIITSYLTFHSLILLLSGFFLILKACLPHNSLDINVIINGTNSTSSTANLFGISDGCGGAGVGGSNSSLGRRSSRRRISSSTVAGINLIINISLVASTFSSYWLPKNWQISNVITWSQLIESLLTSILYWLVHTLTKSSSSSLRTMKKYNNHTANSSGADSHTSSTSSSTSYNHHLHPQNNQFPITNGSLCFNNGEFQYFAGGKNNIETMLNNASSSAYNTFDSFHQPMSYPDSLRCASVTTIANDDFEFLSRRGPSSSQHPQEVHQGQLQQLFHPYQSELFQGKIISSEDVVETLPITTTTSSIRPLRTKNGRGRSLTNFGDTTTVQTSLSMNDLDLIDDTDESPTSTTSRTTEDDDEEYGGHTSSTAYILPSTTSTNKMDSNSRRSKQSKYKYKKNSSRNKKRFSNSNKLSLNRRVLSLESLHNHVNESHLAYLDTGERVIVFTTDFL